MFERLIHPDQKEEIREISKKNQAGKKKSTTHIEIKMIRKNGEIRWIDLFARSIIYQNRPAGMNISIDITRRKKLKKFWMRITGVRYKLNILSSLALIHWALWSFLAIFTEPKGSKPKRY